MKKQIGILAVLLLVMAALSFGAWALTEKQIDRNEEASIEAARSAVLPGSASFTEEEFESSDGVNENIEGVWKSDKGYAIETKAYGYHDDVCLMVGVDMEGKVVGLQVLELNETPGLGRQAKNDRDFLSQFLGTAGTAALDDNVDALSGATVTTKAFIKAVNAASAYVTGADISSGATEWEG
ncbi:MAG: FMN-binding protein [Oscillospiraceae bacterium]